MPLNKLCVFFLFVISFCTFPTKANLIVAIDSQITPTIDSQISDNSIPDTNPTADIITFNGLTTLPPPDLFNFFTLVGLGFPHSSGIDLTGVIQAITPGEVDLWITQTDLTFTPGAYTLLGELGGTTTEGGSITVLDWVLSPTNNAFDLTGEQLLAPPIIPNPAFSAQSSREINVNAGPYSMTQHLRLSLISGITSFDSQLRLTAVQAPPPSVPEPSTLAIFALAALVFFCKKTRLIT